MSSFDFKDDLTWRDFLIRAALVIGTVAIIVWLMPRPTNSVSTLRKDALGSTPTSAHPSTSPFTRAMRSSAKSATVS